MRGTKKYPYYSTDIERMQRLAGITFVDVDKMNQTQIDEVINDLSKKVRDNLSKKEETMTEDEFIFWEKAFIATLSGRYAIISDAKEEADKAVEWWRLTKKLVKNSMENGPYRDGTIKE